MPWIAIALALSAFFCCRLMGRLRSTRRALESWIAESGFSLLPQSSRRSLLSLIEALRYRVSIAEGRARAPRGLAFDRSEGLPPNHSQAATCLIARIELVEGREHIIFEGHGSRGERFEHRLRQYLSAFLMRNDEQIFGIRDESLSDSLFGGFSRFGFTYTICFPIRGVLGGAPVRQVLWCGYVQDTRPPERELRLLSDFARDLGDAISSRETIRSLHARATEAEFGNREKGDFIAQMSHDMRSPLYNVKSILNLLQLESHVDESRELLEVARANCESLEELIQDVLDLTRHRAGKLDANLEVFDLAACMRQVADNYAITARAKGLGWDIFRFDEVASVHADRRQVKRVLSNIISNAIKYTQSGSISVQLVAGEGEWRLLVRDSGCGMSGSELEQLFKPFSRFRPGAADGIGLGLAISKILIELNSGKISVRSDINRGSEFEVSFPRSSHVAKLPHLAQAAGSSCRPPLDSSVSILVVDDDAGCVESLGRLLEKAGYRVLKAYGVRDAMNVMNIDPPNYLISDAQMPEGGALRLLRFVRERAFDCPMAVLSGADDVRRAAEFAAAGIDRVLTKPVHVSEVYSWICAHSIARHEAHPRRQLVANT